MNYRTRIKICGLTRVEDVQAAVAAGADAIGLVFYPQSPRYIDPEVAAKLIAVIPPFVTVVGLFVNATPQTVKDVVARAPVSVLQFHGDETVEQCCAIAHDVNRPFIRAIRIRSDTRNSDLIKYEQDFRVASNLFSGLLFDAFVAGYGGGGKVFDWSLIPAKLGPEIILSGGLTAQNATEAVLRVRPYAVDVSSGVELSKGIKDSAQIRAFISAVRQADALRGNEKEDES